MSPSMCQARPDPNNTPVTIPVTELSAVSKAGPHSAGDTRGKSPPRYITISPSHQRLTKIEVQATPGRAYRTLVHFPPSTLDFLHRSQPRIANKPAFPSLKSRQASCVSERAPLPAHTPHNAFRLRPLSPLGELSDWFLSEERSLDWSRSACQGWVLCLDCSRAEPIVGTSRDSKQGKSSEHADLPLILSTLHHSPLNQTICADQVSSLSYTRVFPSPAIQLRVSGGQKLVASQQQQRLPPSTVTNHRRLAKRTYLHPDSDSDLSALPDEGATTPPHKGRIKPGTRSRSLPHTSLRV